MLRNIPPKWRSAEIAVGSTIADAVAVNRIALHRNLSGRQVVVLYAETIDVRSK